MNLEEIGKELRELKEYKALGTVEEIEQKFELLRQYQEQGSIKDFLQLREKTCELLEQLDKEVSQQSIINKLWRKFELNRLIGQRHV